MSTEMGIVISVISVILAIAGGFIGLAGWLSGRDKKISVDAEWRGRTSQNLKDIKDGVSGIGDRMAKIEGTIALHDTQIAIINTKIGINKTSSDNNMPKG